MTQQIFTDSIWFAPTLINGGSQPSIHQPSPFVEPNFTVPRNSIIRFEFTGNVGYGYVIGANRHIYNSIVNNTIQNVVISLDDVDVITNQITDEECENYCKITGVSVTSNVKDQPVNTIVESFNDGVEPRQTSDEPITAVDSINTIQQDDSEVVGEVDIVEDDEPLTAADVINPRRQFLNKILDELDLFEEDELEAHVEAPVEESEEIDSNAKVKSEKIEQNVVEEIDLFDHFSSNNTSNSLSEA